MPLDPFLRPISSFGSKFNPLNNHGNQMAGGTTIQTQAPIEELSTQWDQRVDRGQIRRAKLAAGVIGTEQIADNSIGSNALMTNAVSSLKIQANAVTNAKINDVAWTKLMGGTGILGDSANTQGVFQLKDSSSNVIGTMGNTGVQFFAGTLGTMTIGTSLIQGGTSNAGTYQVGGTAGATGTAVYVKTVDFVGSTTTLGTIVVQKGIVTTIN
jgi:hypothetical protein